MSETIFQQASQVSAKRSMILFAAGALIGLAIAGYGLFTAAGTSTRTVPPEDLALVNQRPILRSDFIAQLESETGATFDQATKEDKLKVLDEMIREELLVQRGLELDFAETDQDTRNALVTVVNQQVIAEVTTSRPTEQQLQDFYNKNRERYATEGIMTVRNLVLPKIAGAAEDNATTPAMIKAREIVTALRGNLSVEQSISRFGLLEVNKHDEEFYFAAKIHLGDALFAKVVQLADGEVSDPFVGEDGIRIVKMVRNAKPMPLSFERSHPQVLTDYKGAQQTRLTEATMKFLRDRSRIMIAADYANDYKP